MGEVIDLGVQIGLVDKAGAWYSYNGERIGQGKKNSADYLHANLHLADEIETLIRAKLLKSGEPATNEAVGETLEDDLDDKVTPISGG